MRYLFYVEWMKHGMIHQALELELEQVRGDVAGHAGCRIALRRASPPENTNHERLRRKGKPGAAPRVCLHLPASDEA
jgi:hypothetical protein